MTRVHYERRPTSPPRRGYTLIEMVLTLTIMTVVGSVASHVIIESMRVYARSAPAHDATYHVRSCVERMKRELRGMKDRPSLYTMTSSSISFHDAEDTGITYAHAGDTLTRNGDLLADGVTAFELEYWAADGTAAAVPDELHLVEIDLTVERSGQSFRLQTAVFPRVLGHE